MIKKMFETFVAEMRYFRRISLLKIRYISAIIIRLILSNYFWHENFLMS